MSFALDLLLLHREKGPAMAIASIFHDIDSSRGEDATERMRRRETLVKLQRSATVGRRVALLRQAGEKRSLKMRSCETPPARATASVASMSFGGPQT